MNLHDPAAMEKLDVLETSIAEVDPKAALAVILGRG